MSRSPTKLKLVGCDPSLTNWGLAIATYDLESKRLVIDHLELINPVVPTGKQVRQNSKDLETAKQLTEGTVNVARGAHAMFVEVPVGSQSARAMASYGVCVGVLGALRGGGIQFMEVTATEVKLAGYGQKTASKQQMIDWAANRHPEANWIRHRHSSPGKPNSQGVIVGAYNKGDLTSSNEHLADAVAAIHAGIASNPFQQLLPLLAAQT